jgi:ABC-type transport system involved in multi-copper enzyme maturation permease subunit
MSVSDLNKRHLWLVSAHGARYALRGGTGLVFLMLVLTCGLLVGHLLITPMEQAIAKQAEEGHEVEMVELIGELKQHAKGPVAWAIRARTNDDMAEEEVTRIEDESDVWATYLLDERPAVLSAILLILLFALPYLIAIGAFNQFSGDIQTRGLRFLLLRTERANLFFGRFLGTAIFSIGTMALLIATIALYVGLKLQIYDFGELFTWSAMGFAALAVLTLPYVALCSWISSAIDSPFGSLTVSSLIIGVVPLFAVIGRMTWEPVAYVNYVLPWGIQNNLLHHSAGNVAIATAACLGYTVLFLTLGYRHFSKRDL